MHGPIFSTLVGLDYSWQPWLLTGIAGGYERVDIYTGFNNGNQASNGVIFASYAAIRLSPSFSLDGQIGHAWIGYNGSHGGVSSAFTGDRWFGSANVKAKTTIDAWQLVGSVGYFYVAETQGSYTESNGNVVPSSMPYLGQVRVKGEVGYRFETQFGALTPFASARLEFDTQHGEAPVINSAGQRAAVSEFGTTFGAGLKADLGDYTSLILEGKTTQFRQYFEAYGVNASLRIRF